MIVILIVYLLVKLLWFVYVLDVWDYLFVDFSYFIIENLCIEGWSERNFEEFLISVLLIIYIWSNNWCLWSILYNSDFILNNIFIKFLFSHFVQTSHSLWIKQRLIETRLRLLHFSLLISKMACLFVFWFCQHLLLNLLEHVHS